jgi:hypothetical protein
MLSNVISDTQNSNGEQQGSAGSNCCLDHFVACTIKLFTIVTIYEVLKAKSNICQQG